MVSVLLKDLAHPHYQAFVLSDCTAEDILSEKEENTFLAAVEVPTEQGTVFYNDTFGGKQMKQLREMNQRRKS
ncbi:hypothetical protein [Sporosarcina obsidiansis]|uniref:hypothetical protein n=1 Tax=Sporosarcina obsidiansis TaxID=2660748 RepID=UPI00129BCB5B|nr:hypothetical protein [Sporosarcina obsidiansis]